MSKPVVININIREVEPGVYQIKAEDDVAVASYYTRQPKTTVLDILKEFKVSNPRGRPKGSKNKEKAIEEGVVDMKDFSPVTCS